MDRTERTIKAIAEAIARGECPPRTTPREWTHFEKQAKAVFYDLVLTVQLHDDDDESPAKAATVLHPAIREGVEAAFEGRDGWMTKIAAAARHLPTEDAKVGGDEREAFEAWARTHVEFDSLLGRDSEGAYKTDFVRIAWRVWQARAALSADGKSEPEHTAIYLSKRLVGHDGEASFIQAHINQAVSEAVEALSADGGDLKAEQVEWVVNDNAELGVKIGRRFFWLYKGESLVYKEAKHDDGSPMHWRPVFKREFGECAHPVNYENPALVGTVSLDDSEDWRPLSGNDLDEAIDAAIAAKQSGKGGE